MKMSTTTFARCENKRAKVKKKKRNKTQKNKQLTTRRREGATDVELIKHRKGNEIDQGIEQRKRKAGSYSIMK